MQRLALSALAMLPCCLALACAPMDLAVGDKNPMDVGGDSGNEPGTSGSSMGGSSTSVVPGKAGEAAVAGQGPDMNDGPVFYCWDKQSKIDAGRYCDGQKDCMDGSDEIGCPPSGESFLCTEDMLRIPLSSVCDGKQDCPAAQDEHNCLTELYACGDGKTQVPVEAICNQKKECPNGSDEANCPITFFDCKDGKRLEAKLRCDGVPHCAFGEDEADCPQSFFTCSDGSNKIEIKRVCDKVPDCKDGSDETCAADPFICHDQHSKIEASRVCDGTPDCDDKSDEADCELDFCQGMGVARGPRYDEAHSCLLPEEVIGCLWLIPPDKSVPSYWPMSTCLHRKSDGAVFLVPSPQFSSEWQDCSSEELTKVADVSSCN
jgi:Low-density lipoprotein receptor domain class A